MDKHIPEMNFIPQEKLQYAAYKKIKRKIIYIGRISFILLAIWSVLDVIFMLGNHVRYERIVTPELKEKFEAAEKDLELTKKKRQTAAEADSENFATLKTFKSLIVSKPPSVKLLSVEVNAKEKKAIIQGFDKDSVVFNQYVDILKKNKELYSFVMLEKITASSVGTNKTFQINASLKDNVKEW